MKKIILVILLAIIGAYAAVKPIKIEVKRPDWKDPFIYILEDVRNYQWIYDKAFLRVWFYSGQILDLPIGNYEVKINK